ncbi:MAG TPA: 4'-phosphopantetheinyl transferase superfamily protein [Methylotenera sp.]|nr:4'-phosphopantetheinyl transferase superfamily protein [Methylotenera sp.]
MDKQAINIRKTIYLNVVNNALEEAPDDKCVIIEIEQFATPFINRRQQRQEQSRIARLLLDHSLKSNFSHHASLWSLSKLDNGKPVLQGMNAPSISIAHSGNWVTCALSSSIPVGIDIERIRPVDWEACHSFAFHPNEAEWILNGNEHEKNIRGLTLWCLKEAMIKAAETSSNYQLSDFCFSPEGKLISAPEVFNHACNWASHTMIINNEAIMAVVWRNNIYS